MSQAQDGFPANYDNSNAVDAVNNNPANDGHAASQSTDFDSALYITIVGSPPQDPDSFVDFV